MTILYDQKLDQPFIVGISESFSMGWKCRTGADCGAQGPSIKGVERFLEVVNASFRKKIWLGYMTTCDGIPDGLLGCNICLLLHIFPCLYFYLD